MVFVSAKEGPPNYGPKEPYTVQYFDEKGNMTIRSGGKKTWRNNNVGNLKYFKKGSFASRNGAIGVANQMAINIVLRKVPKSIGFQKKKL